MYIYHALINALGAHMIHINLNMILNVREGGEERERQRGRRGDGGNGGKREGKI